MELNDLNYRSRSQKLNSLLDTRFGFQLELDKVTEKSAVQMIAHAENEMSTVKESVTAYQADKKYLAAKLAKDCLEAWAIEQNLNINEDNDKDADEESSRFKPNDGKIDPQQKDPTATSQRNTALRALVGPTNYAKARRALDMYKKGQTVPPVLMSSLMPIMDMVDEIMASGMANTRMLQMIDKRAKKSLGIPESKQINEGEMENAELVLAAKDMVDRIQGMLEDVGEMMNEDLLPLTDSIRDEMGNEKAEAFSNAARGSLEAFLAAVTTARGDMDNASRILTGTAESTPVDISAGGDDEMSMDMDADADTDLDMDIDAGDEGQEGDANLDREERI
jgi:hypothetical protein